MNMVKPLDLMFIGLESASRPLHMAGFEIFELPARYRGDYITDLVEAFRQGDIGAPFNKVITGLERGIPRWAEQEPDLRYHVRHLAVPSPGRMDQLYELISFVNAPILDRSRPLWECYVIEGVEQNRFAILFKVHHALIDGLGGMKLFEKSLNTRANSREFKTVWQPHEPRKHKAGSKQRVPSFAQLVPGIQKTASKLLDTSRELASFRPQNMLMPFSATRSTLNSPTLSNERRFAACDLSLPLIKRLGKATGTTVNDVVMAAIDLGLQRYLEEQDATIDEPLRVMMPMSLAHRGKGKGGNQVSVLLTELGKPGQKPLECLQSIHDSNDRIKQEAAKVPPGALQLYTMLLAGGAVATEAVPGLDRTPTNNLLISNMPGPRGKLYLAGAPLIGFYGLPIVPPGSGLNITFLSCGDAICLAVGANPDAVDSPFTLTGYISDALDDLAREIEGGNKPKRKRKKAPARRSRSNK